MSVPWLVVGQLLLGNLDKIIDVVKPVFTRRKADASPNQPDLLNQQIAELQTASTSNAEQTALLAAQLKELIATISLAADEANAQRAHALRMSRVAIGVAVAAVLIAAMPWFIR